MKKFFFSLLFVMLSVVTFGQQWVAIKSDTPSTLQTELLSSSESSITVKLQVPGFYAFEVATPRGEANIISVPRAVSTAEAGEPDLPMIAIPALVGDQQHYSIRVLDAQYIDFQMEVAPSKGDFPRTVNPEDVPYTYGEAYNNDAFFPAQNVGLYEPYVFRDFRGQNMVIYPFAYNPITHTLRVYYNMTIELLSDGMNGENTISRRSSEMSMDPEIKAMYANHFINYQASMDRYTPVDETGELLIICHDAFMNAMQPFVNWKKQIGRPTTMVGTSTAGSTDSAIKTYIQNQYNSNSNLTHVLLVGDVAQIPGHSYSGCGSYNGKSDNWYGQVAGNDSYNDIIVGRFCVENETQVTTHVNKILHYERDINANDTWLPVGQGIGKNEGAGGGHYGEADYEHIDNIRDDLLDYNYTTVHRDYQGVTGVSSSAAIISQHINEGVSIINYCNHGSATSWGVFSYSNANVNALTNDNKLPIIWSVACLVGRYDYNGTCFAETWMRATNNTTDTPTGAIGGMFSYISQPWQPPMYGQDEMVDVLVESNSSNIKRTLGGCSFDGNMKILDQYGQSGGQGLGTYLSWILYGDPTLTLRNAVPTDMGVSHASSMSSTATSLTVNATNGNGALATLTFNNEILGSATINNGTANITFTAPGTSGTATLTVFGYNKITYVGTVSITGGGTQYYNVSVMANPTDGGTVSGDGGYQAGQSCTVTATPNDGYTFVNWMENNNVVSTNATYTFTVTGNHYLMANFSVQAPTTYTVSVSANPANGGTVTGGGTYNQGASCTVTATASSGYTFTNWTEGGNVVSTDASYTFTVTGNRTLVANFSVQAPTTYTVSVSANPANGGTVTGGGTYNQGASCTVTATASSGYTFTNWTEGGNVVSTDASYTFTVTGNRQLVANFQALSYTVTVAANPSAGGEVTGGGTFDYGESCIVAATPSEGYSFVNWTENGSHVSSNASFGFTVTGDRNLVANFQIRSYTISVSANPSNGGTISGGGTYNHGASCTLTASPNTGYTFLGWTKNGQQVSTSPTYTFTVTEAASYVAQFEAQVFTITLTANPTEGGTVEGDSSGTYGQTVLARAIPHAGYYFINWTENGEIVSTDDYYLFILTENRNLVANFGRTTYTLTATADPAESATIIGGGTYDWREEVTVTAIPNEDWAFQNWTDDNGVVVSENLSYTFTIEYNRNLVAHFMYTVGIGESGNSVKVYPNPTKGEVTVEGEGLSHVRILNLYGQTVYNAIMESDQVRIDLSGFAKGIYMMHLEADGSQAVRKIVVE